MVVRKALVIGLVVVAALGFASLGESLSGTWNTDIILDLTAGPVSYTHLTLPTN